GNPGINTAVTWSTSAPQIVAVSGGGVVTGVAGGSALITATSVQDNTKQDTVTVFVNGSLANSWSASRLNGPLYEDVLSMYVTAPDNAWAVNLMGDVFRYNGTAWTKVLAGSTFGTSFRGVHGSSATNVFAVGTNGKIMRWNGTSWNGVASNTTRNLNA